MESDKFIYDFIGTTQPILPDGEIINGVEPEKHETYNEYRFDDAQKLLSALDFDSPIFKSSQVNMNRKFLFRGHQDASWNLEPSIFRDKLPEGFEISTYGNRKNRYNAHKGARNFQYECVPFLNFLDSMDNLGLFIEPECEELLKAYRIMQQSEGGSFAEFLPLQKLLKQFPSDSQQRCLALAQHYGIPTRLLDWTSNPYVALFMATEGIDLFSTNNKSRFAIWVMPQTLLKGAEIIKGMTFVNKAKIDNRNIVAQQGFFTSHIPPFESDKWEHVVHPNDSKRERFPYLDEYLIDGEDNEQYLKFLEKFNSKPLCFTLDTELVSPIRRKLDQLNINWNTMMPNLEGAKKEAKRQIQIRGLY